MHKRANLRLGEKSAPGRGGREIVLKKGVMGHTLTPLQAKLMPMSSTHSKSLHFTSSISTSAHTLHYCIMSGSVRKKTTAKKNPPPSK
ncbi:hypothetical protein Lal_00039220 [Lupinus albus]|nr:hypothetical protein Lal_00039220 [Lupinus albus]